MHNEAYAQAYTVFELAVCNSQFAKHFGSLQMSFCIFSKSCKSLKSDTSWMYRDTVFIELALY